MDIRVKIDELKQKGFVNVGSSFLSQMEINELCVLSKKIFEEISPHHPDFIPDHSGVNGVMRLPQHHPRIAELLDHLVANASFKLTLEASLGSDYKIWQVNMRRSSPRDKGLYLHQDAQGEMGVCILLSDNMNGSGATVFLPSSHLVPKRMKVWRVEAPAPLLKLLRYLFTPLSGKAGDIGFFFNRTWHGRFPNQSANFYDVIFISFFPAGHCLGYEGYGDWSAEFLSAIRGTELGRLIDPSIGTERQSDGLFKILSTKNKSMTDLPYAFAIETYQGRQHRLNNYKLRATIIFLRAIMGLGRPFARLFRKVIGYLALGK